MHRSCLSSWSWQLASDRPKTFSAMNDAHLNLNTNYPCTLLNIYTHARARIIPACHWCDSEKCQVTRMQCMNTLNASIDSMKLQHQINRNNQWCVCLRAWRHASRDCLSVCLSVCLSLTSSWWRCCLLSPGDADAVTPAFKAQSPAIWDRSSALRTAYSMRASLRMRPAVSVYTCTDQSERRAQANAWILIKSFWYCVARFLERLETDLIELLEERPKIFFYWNAYFYL